MFLGSEKLKTDVLVENSKSGISYHFDRKETGIYITDRI